jgi:uncharacterized protein (TIGR02145 family)
MKKTIFLLMVIALSSNTKAQTVTDFDGNVYNTIAIGTQVWMKENLNTTHYRNGNAIQKVSNSTSWYNLFNSGGAAMCYYNNDSAANASAYGALYNWHAAHSSNNLCPADWHVPTDAEWTILTDYLYNNGYAYQGSGFDIAKSLAATSGWTVNATAGNVGNDLSSNDSSNFSALPAGVRSEYGTYTDQLSSAYWWTYTADDSFDAWNRSMNYNSAFVSRNAVKKEKGASVRCICDFLTTDIKENNNDLGLNIFPNPSTGLINLNFDESAENCRIEVLNSFGQVILSKDINNQIQATLDLTKFAKAMYFIKMQSGGMVVLRKVVISE